MPASDLPLLNARLHLELQLPALAFGHLASPSRAKKETKKNYTDLSMNFKNMAPDGNEGRPPGGNFSLARQPSVYSLTFDEFQNTMGSIGKDFGSMNMDEFLKNIWTAEETQAMASAAFGAPEGGGVGGSLQRQGSLTLPRTLSQKTVDEVWRDIYKESGGRDGGGGNSGPNFQQRQQQRQPTLGEMTLEEFLVRAGVVREDPQPAARPNNTSFYGELLNLPNNMGLGLGFPDQSNEIGANQVQNNNNQISNQSPNLPINVNGVRTSHQERPQLQQQQLYPKQATMGYAPSMQFTSNAEAGNQVMKNGIMGIGDAAASNGFVQGGCGPLQGGGGGMCMVGLGAGGVTVAMESPSQLSSDGIGKSNGDTSSLSPSPYVFNGGLRGRKCSGAVEKVVERRQRRMIKNRESAARSRARKQAYTMELEAEVAKLKEENKELQRKQAVIMEMQKNQVLEMMNQQPGPKRRCLRRTLTGPW